MSKNQVLENRISGRKVDEKVESWTMGIEQVD